MAIFVNLVLVPCLFYRKLSEYKEDLEKDKNSGKEYENKFAVKATTVINSNINEILFLFTKTKER